MNGRHKQKNRGKNSQDQFRKMTETPISGLILSLAAPTIASMMVTNLYNTADTWFVSRAGTSASGAVSVVFSLMAIYQAFGFMFGHGAGSNISRKLGEKREDLVKTYASTSLFLSLACGAAALRYQAISCLFLSYSIAAGMLFQSIGVSGRASFLAALRAGVCFLPLILILPRVFGIVGIELAQPCADIVSTVISVAVTEVYLAKLKKIPDGQMI